RPFCYDESLDGVTESLISTVESDSNDSLTQTLSYAQDVSKDNRDRKTDDVVENELE
ncbi:hypothetical protein LOAG_15661, partial [Loa loa]